MTTDNLQSYCTTFTSLTTVPSVTQKLEFENQDGKRGMTTEIMKTLKLFLPVRTVVC